MLYVSNNGETCKDQLCQHPECWQSNIRRVREAVRQRYGIKRDQDVGERSTERSDEKERQSPQSMKSFSLPTLKIVDMTKDLMAPHESSVDIVFDEPGVQNMKSIKCLHSSMTHHSARLARCPVPHTTPISPSLPERHASLLREKRNCTTSCGSGDEKMTTINFHEIYDYNEVCQDWQDMFISTAYLVWCPSKKKKRKKERRARSAVTAGNRGGFKNPIEEMLPLPLESNKKKYMTTSKVPTGGQPYSPCRSPVSRMCNVGPTDYISDGDFVMALTKEEIPKLLMASKKIIEQKPNMARKDDQLTELKKSSSTKVLVDISATLTAPVDGKRRSVDEEKIFPEPGQPSIRENPDKGRTRFLKRASDFEPRKMFRLPSIAIPWSMLPERIQSHCKNSIPRNVDLDVMMEPVLYLPRAVSGGRSGVCANVGAGKEEASKAEQRTGPSKGLVEERNHITSAYRISPKNVSAPAPTPATPRTRDSQRHFSGPIRPSTKDSLSRTRLGELSETGQGALEGAELKRKMSDQTTRARNDQAILEVAETNREAVEEIGNELSRLSLSQNKTQANADVSAGGADNDPGSQSGMSDRAISPSSRTNIPQDIWAELQKGGAFDHRRIIPRSNLEVRHADRPRSMFRGYHSSLGLSIYSFPGETSWRPLRPKPPKTLAYMGVYKPAVLPKMPAALTVVPVPSVARHGQGVQPREVKTLGKVRSVRMPPVPRGSPVPNIELATASSSSVVPSTSRSEVYRISELKCEEPRSLESLHQEQMPVEEVSIPEQISQESEYLIAREVVQEPGEEIPLDDEDEIAGAAQIGDDASAGRGHDDSQDTLMSMEDASPIPEYTIEDAILHLDSITGEIFEPADHAEPKITCSEKEITCSQTAITCSETVITPPEPDVACTNSEVSMMSRGESDNCPENEITCLKEELACPEDEITCSNDKITSSEDKTASSKDEITCIKIEDTSLEEINNSREEVMAGSKVMCTNDEVTCTNDDITCTNDDITCTNDDITCTNDDITGTNEEVAYTNDITGTNDDITGTNDNITGTNDNITCSADESTKEETTCKTRDNNITAHDTIVTTTKDESGEKSTSQKHETTKEGTNSPVSIQEESTRQLKTAGEQKSSLKVSSPTMPGSQRSLLIPGQEPGSTLSESDFIPRVPSSFELMPYNVESNLLQPIKIDSDLLLLNDDSFMDLSFDDDLTKLDEVSENELDGDNLTE